MLSSTSGKKNGQLSFCAALCGSHHVVFARGAFPPLGDARIACRQWMSQRQRDDMVILAHIREQHRLSLQSYGRPLMTEELKELGLKVGHRRVGRLMGENGIKIIRTQKYKATTDPCPAGYAQHAREGVTTRSTSHQICWIKISQRQAPIRNGLATSAISGPVGLAVSCRHP